MIDRCSRGLYAIDDGNSACGLFHNKCANSLKNYNRPATSRPATAFAGLLALKYNDMLMTILTGEPGTNGRPVERVTGALVSS